MTRTQRAILAFFSPGFPQPVRAVLLVCLGIAALPILVAVAPAWFLLRGLYDLGKRAATFLRVLLFDDLPA